MAEGPNKPFPAITGGCWCSSVRYRLLTSPLFCFACHCLTCQKRTGSAFSLHLQIEFFAVQILTPTRPVLAPRFSSRGVEQIYECEKCKTILWLANFRGVEGICDVRIGTLDFPSLMEPDVHCYIESKLDWVGLPKGARTVKGEFNRELWPKSSHRRVEVMHARLAEAKKKLAEQKAANAGVKGPEEKNTSGGNGAVSEEVAEEVGAEGEKTPTAVELGEEDDEEDDEAFEQRYRETEKALRERLEKLTLKLEKEGHEKQADVVKTT